MSHSESKKKYAQTEMEVQGGNGGPPSLGTLTDLLKSQSLTQDAASIPPESVGNRTSFTSPGLPWESQGPSTDCFPNATSTQYELRPKADSPCGLKGLIWRS